MPLLRLFGPVADAAGARLVVMPGATVDEVLAAAERGFGPAFAEQARRCRVWVNGDMPPPGTRLAEGDEVALLPPVSGG